MGIFSDPQGQLTLQSVVESSSLLKYFDFNHVWDNKKTLSVPRLIHALKMLMSQEVTLILTHFNLMLINFV